MTNSSLTSIQKFSIGLYFAVIFFNLQGLTSFGTTGLLVFGLWAISAMIAFGRELREFSSSRRFRCLMIFLLFYFLSSTIAESVTVSVNRCVAFLCVASPIIMYEIVKDKGDKLKLVFLVFTAIIWCVNIILSYSFMEIIGTENLRGASNFSDDPQFYIIGVVFNMCYAFSILVPGMVEVFRKYRAQRGSKLWLRLLLVGISVVCLLYLIRAQFMTSLILAVIGAISAYFYKGKKNVITVVVVLAAVAFLFIEIYPQCRHSINSEKYNDIVYRLDEIYATLTGNSNEAQDMNSRQDLTALSLETFSRNPIFGVNHKLVGNIHVIDQGVGNHAEWPDSLARYGMFAILLFVFLWDSLNQQRLMTGAYFPTFLFLLLGFLNPMWFFPQMYATFIVLPLLNDLMVKDIQ